MIGNRALCAGFCFPWRVNIAVVRWGFCADYVMKFASSPSSCVRFISFGFLLATTCVCMGMDGMLLALCDHGFERSG